MGVESENKKMVECLLYLHNFLGNLSGFVDIQDDLGIPHHGIECPSLTEAEKQKGEVSCDSC